jgi:hypothetical protein
MMRDDGEVGVNMNWGNCICLLNYLCIILGIDWNYGRIGCEKMVKEMIG